MPTEALRNDFATLPIFLIVKRDGGCRGPVQVVQGAGHQVEFPGANHEGDVLEKQGVVIDGFAVFARSQQVK